MTQSQIISVALRLARRLSRLLGRLRRPRKRYRGLRGRGQSWEELAERHLRDAGYLVLERNYRTRIGELDFVAREGDTLCFIEVKGRRGTGFGLPEEAVTLEKRRHILRVAEVYLQKNRVRATACRFDVVSILDEAGKQTISILRNAFEGPLPPRLRR